MSEHDRPADEPRPDETRDPGGRTTGIEDYLTSRETWMRFLFMCLSVLLLWIAGIAGAFVVIVGFLWVLFTGEVNSQLAAVGRRLATYVAGIIRFLTFNSEERPFPLGGEWPSADT